MFIADSYATFFRVLFLAAAALTVLISLHYLDDEDSQHGEYYALLLFATIGMMMMGGGGDVITIYLGLELMSLSTYVLAGFIRQSAASTEAAVKYFLMGAFTSGILLYGLALLYGLTGTTNLEGIAQGLSGLSIDNPALILAVILVVAGFGFKVAAVPFHMWAPDAYEGAPTPVTAFMSSAVKAAAFAGLGRLFIAALFPAAQHWETLWWVLAALTMILGNVVAISQTSLKRMLAYSSISHAGLQICAYEPSRTRPRHLRSRTPQLCVFTKHASSEGSVPHPGLPCILGLAVWAGVKRGAGVRRLRHFPDVERGTRRRPHAECGRC
jgi:NADH-quinone oxidoreductase subunit N